VNGAPETDGELLRIIDVEEVRAMGADVRAAFMLEAAEGYAFGANYMGDAVTESIMRGQHGYLPSRYFTTFIASGASITRRGDLGEISITNVGPSIAQTIGLTLRDADGQALSLSEDV
jgi:hypothetical protein